MSVVDRFLKYISIPSNSDSNSLSSPSSRSQFDMAKVLVKELKNIGLNVQFDKEHCYVYAVLKGDSNAKKIGFVSHMDTSDYCTDIDIKPQFINNYDGKNIVLKNGSIIDVKFYPYLKTLKGKTIITTDGTTLLGSDDKAGIAEIISMLENVVKSGVSHGDIYVAFTPDEEVGKSLKYFDFDKFKPDYAFTVDGEDINQIDYGNMNIATLIIEINGIVTHVGDAKNRMVNSQKIAMEIINSLPNECPENTDGLEGFYHLQSISGSVGYTKLIIGIRDFDTDKFNERINYVNSEVKKLNKKYGKLITLEISENFRNMKDIMSEHMCIIDNCQSAMTKLGLKPRLVEVRGGFDGAGITEHGIPCPNLGTGGTNLHSVYECVAVEDMEKMVELLTLLVKSTANK